MATIVNPIEAIFLKALSNGEDVSLQDVGGMEALLPHLEELGQSPVMPEVLDLLLRHWKDIRSEDRVRALHQVLHAASNDLALIEAVDVLDAHRPLPDSADEECFSLFLSKAKGLDGDLTGLARGTALDGAFRWAAKNRRWQFRLLDYLLGLSLDEDHDFLNHAAKIVGVAYSHWGERDLLPVLTALANAVPANAEAIFELGMANLADGLDAPDREDARVAFGVAQSWFEKAASMSESCPEASIYGDCLRFIGGFDSGFVRESLRKIRDSVSVHTFELNAWHGDLAAPSWLGSRRTEAVCWNVLLGKLTGLLEDLEEVSWWEPRVVIEQHVLAAYNAGRCILERTKSGGLETLLRPRVVAGIATYAGQAHQLKKWLQHNADHTWANEAKSLIAEIDRLVEKEVKQQNPTEAVGVWPPLAASISMAHLPAETKTRLLSMISNAFSLHLGNLTMAEISIIDECGRAVENHSDYRANPHGAILFGSSLLWIVRFLNNRLEVTKKDDPTVGYLFERGDGTFPLENELQDDFFRWISTVAAGSDLEATNVGGGRADIRMKSSGERLVIEVKRELSDASFDALAKSYEAQATDYQNVSIRLGFLLVLDLATPNSQGTPHITSLIQPRVVQRVGENEPRHIIIVKMPGRRKRPSDLSRKGKRQ